MTEILEYALLEAGAIALVVGVILEVIKEVEVVDTKRWLPAIALGLGIILGLVYAIITNEPLVVYTIAGLIGGATSSGIYDNIQSVKGEI